MAKPLTAGEKIARDLCEMDAPTDNIIEVDPADVARRIDEEVFPILGSLADCAFRNERLEANYASLQEENNALRRIHAENLAIKDAEIARLKTVPMKYHRMEFNAKLQAENASLRAEVERLNAVIESNIDEGINKIMHMSDEQISALAGFEGRSTEDQETIARQCFEIAEQRADHMKLVEENHELRQQLAASQLEARRLREALEMYGRHVPDCHCNKPINPCDCGLDEALSSPTSTDALDAYVAEKSLVGLSALKAENEELRKDAERYRWLRDATGETPLRPAAFGSEMYPDMRLKLDFPTIVSYDAVGNVTTLDQAIDAAMAKGEQ